MPDDNCLFCKISAGQIPCWKLAEDEHTLAFLDIGPLSPGHTLLIPKCHHATLATLSDPEAAAIGIALIRLGKAVCQATACAGWNVLQNNGAVAGQEVGHVHFHLIPRAANDGLGYRWNAGKLDESAARKLQAGITRCLT